MALALILALFSLQIDEAALRSAIARDARDADARFRLGLVLFKQRKLDESARYLDEAAKLQPSQVLVWRALALVRGTRHDSLGEAQALQKIIELDPADAAAYRKLAALLLDHRTAAAALAVTTAGVARHPADVELLRLRGLALYGLGRQPEAIDAFLAAMDAAPDSELVFASIETLLPEAGERLPAIRQRLVRFTELQPSSPLGYFLLALIDEEKEARLRKAIAVDPEFWPAYLELGRMLSGAEAIAALETTLRLNPASEAAHFALAQLYAEAGDRERATQHRAAHHRLRADAAEAEAQRTNALPRMQVRIQSPRD